MKKPLIAVCAGVLAATLSIGAFAASSTTATTATDSASKTATTETKKQHQKIQLTDEQKAAMEAAHKAQEDAWAALTDAQKQELYALYTQKADAEKALADKYLELGLIDSDKATKMKEEIADRLEKQLSSDKMPMGGAFEGRGPDGGKQHDGEKPADTSTDTASSETAAE